MITHEKKGEINMAAPKKTVKPMTKVTETVKTETTASKAEVKKPVAAVAAPKAEEKEAPKTAVKKEAASKAAAKKETAPKAAKKETAPKAAKKETAKKTTTKKADQKTILHVQFSGKSYAQEDLVKIAQDVWKYDLKQKVRELSSIELYVKPEENKVYYVMNRDFTGSFDI